MRKSILLPLLLTAACAGDRGADTYRVIPDFVARSTPVACEPVDLGGVAAEVVRSATDSTFLVLDAAQRRVTEFGTDLRPVWTLEYAEQGPAAADRAVSAVLLGDTAVAILARGGLRLVILDRAGGLLDAAQLEFVPHSVADGRGDVLITPMPFGGAPGSLLVGYQGGAFREIDVSKRTYADMMVGGLGNSALVETLPDGSALVVHQFFAPRAFHVSADRSVVTPLDLPTPDGTADRIDVVPVPPITAADADAFLLPAMSMSVDRGAGEVFLLTRSGRQIDGRRERAILRLDRRLGYLGSYLLNVNAHQMVVLPHRQSAVVVDDQDRFYTCPLDDGDHAE